MLNRSGTLTIGVAAWRSIVVATRPVYCVLALPAPASNLRHVAAIAADSFATLLPGLARLRRRELMSRTLLTVRAASSSARPPYRPDFLALCLMCLYCRSRFGLAPRGIRVPPSFVLSGPT